MGLRIETEEGRITAYLSGELDHHSIAGMRTEIDNAIEKNHPEELMLDFADVTFMDSSGIGLVMGRYKIMKENGGRVVIGNAPAGIKKVMKLAGLDMLAAIC